MPRKSVLRALISVCAELSLLLAGGTGQDCLNLRMRGAVALLAAVNWVKWP